VGIDGIDGIDGAGAAAVRGAFESVKTVEHAYLAISNFVGDFAAHFFRASFRA
jgi:hypothetical protein